MVVSPEKVLTPVSVSVPSPDLAKEPEPLTIPESVWFAEVLNLRIPALAMFAA